MSSSVLGEIHTQGSARCWQDGTCQICSWSHVLEKDEGGCLPPAGRVRWDEVGPAEEGQAHKAVPRPHPDLGAALLCCTPCRRDWLCSPTSSFHLIIQDLAKPAVSGVRMCIIFKSFEMHLALESTSCASGGLLRYKMCCS